MDQAAEEQARLQSEAPVSATGEYEGASNEEADPASSVGRPEISVVWPRMELGIEGTHANPKGA
ncbi:MAG: hypothetical protein JWN39_3085 [Ilumatobacteraceae bacterium]|nr:hypothetical protein [Ilumatobacteraceae bacterium]